MLDEKPFFSVILPTLNRADYLPFAIQSILNQTFEDFELVISNNSSTDSTEEIVLGFDDRRIKYFKTDVQMPMNEHWNFAIEKATGKYLTFLGDDDAHARIYLESLAAIIKEHKAEVVACRMADYYYNDKFDKYGYDVKADSLITYHFDNKLTVYDSKQAIKNIFASVGLCENEISEDFQSPQLINTAYHHKIFAEIKKRHSELIPDILSGDYYLAIMTLNLTDRYYFLDSPLSFHGVSPVSATVSIVNNDPKKSSETDAKLVSQIKRSPVKILTPINFVADAIILAKSRLGEELDYISLNFTKYIRTLLYIIRNKELADLNVKREKKELAEFINKQDEQTKKILKSDVLHWRTKLRDGIRLKIYKTKLYELMMKRHPKPKHYRLVIEGESSGFRNILECANFVDNKFLDKYSS